MRSLMITTVLAALVTACGLSNPPPETGGSTSAPAAAPADDTAELQAAVAALPAPYNAADLAAGRRVFGQCRSCHTIEAGAPNRIGPNLHGVMGRQAGSLDGFNYSDPLKAAGFVWDAERLDQWLQAPQTFLPGNRMAFAGVRDETQRRDLIAYIEVMSAR
ncbi:MAG: cytochrome c family protein [Hyphomonadaceae bacterium]|nr:cytochrome c family protein [Hyphomonadaceae bacterium]